jgi:RNA polymerase sigma factor (sigma-70 family)
MSNRDTPHRLADWFRRWRRPLRKFLSGRRALPAADLDDVAQEVFLRLMRYDRADLVEHPQAYVYKMAANVAAEWAIRARYSRPHEPKWLAGLQAGERLEQELARRQAQVEIERALMRLSPRQREIMKLQFFEGLTRAEVAQRLGTTERRVKRSLMKSYEQLRNTLDPDLLGVMADGDD